MESSYEKKQRICNDPDRSDEGTLRHDLSEPVNESCIVRSMLSLSMGATTLIESPWRAGKKHDHETPVTRPESIKNDHVARPYIREGFNDGCHRPMRTPGSRWYGGQGGIDVLRPTFRDCRRRTCDEGLIHGEHRQHTHRNMA